MSFNYGAVPSSAMPPMLSGMGMAGPMMGGHGLPGAQGFMGAMMGQATAGEPHFTMPNLILPGMNDSPLEFNMNKNKPPMAINLEITGGASVSDEQQQGGACSPVDQPRLIPRRRPDKRPEKLPRNASDDKEKDQNSTPSDLSTSPAENLVQPPPLWGMGYPVMGMNMIVDPSSLMGLNYAAAAALVQPSAPVTEIPSSTATQQQSVQVKEIIHCKSCTLFPPNPNAPSPTTRERPPGCRTVFVGGLPENITEDIISEVFERCGEISTLRLSKKNFCHIRFVYEDYVDAAIFLSGYRLRIGAHTDAAHNGRLHVDYAQARDDQYEWECRQRALQREQRHRERLEEERLRPASPPPVVHYSDHEAAAVADKIKQDDSFSKAVQVVITWLERGDCNKRNSNTFYSMIQSTNSHVRRLLTEKQQYEDELHKARDILKGRVQGILIQFGQIERVFSAACHKKVWDHFTKAQRKNIDTWRKQSTELKALQLADTLIERQDDEMDVSDEEDSVPNKKRPRSADGKDDSDSLRCQLEAYKNEVDLVKSEMRAELDARDRQIRALQLALQEKGEHARENVLGCGAAISTSAVIDLVDGGDSVKSIDLTKCDGVQVSEKDARLIGVVSTFLHVHPFGASLDYVWSYVRQLEPEMRPSDVEHLLTRFPSLFRQQLSGVGAALERRWIFDGFNQISRAPSPDSEPI